MIYIAYNLIFYKEKNDKNLQFKDKILKIVKDNFPEEEYILPYSQQTRTEIAQKLKCSLNEISGQFLEDLKPVISKCSKILVFPTDNKYIGLGIYWEIMLAKKYNLEIFIYDQSSGKFTNKYNLKNLNNNIYGKESHIFYKEIELL